jgi:cyclic pyranopterin phosphate synthase
MRDGASDDDLRQLIAGIWTRRTDRYSEERAAATPGMPRPAKVEMYQIGG